MSNELENSPDLRVHAVNEYVAESEDLARERKGLNRRNWSRFNLKQNWSRKQRGQSKVFLPRLRMNALQMRSLVKKSLADIDGTVQVEFDPIPRFAELGITPQVFEAGLRSFLHQVNFPKLMGDALLHGAMEGMIYMHVDSRPVRRMVLKAEEVEFMEDPNLPEDANLRAVRHPVQVHEPSWHVGLSLIPFEDAHADPHLRDLYFIYDTEIDYHELVKMAEDPASKLDMFEISKIQDSFSDMEKAADKNARRDSLKSATTNSRRKVIHLQIFYGTFLSQSGEAVVFEDEYGNKTDRVVSIVANKRYEIMHPQPIPNWLTRIPVYSSPLISIRDSAFPGALFDPVAELNKDTNELFSLQLDGAIGAVHGIAQIRRDWIDNQRDLENGLNFGQRIMVNADAPAGAKAVEIVATGNVPPESLQMQALLQQEEQRAGLTNETQIGQQARAGALATELVQAGNALAGTFEGITVDLEKELIEPMLKHALLEILQHKDDFSDAELIELFGAKNAEILQAIDPVELYALVVSSVKLRIKGLSSVLLGLTNFRKIIELLQVLGSNPALAETFLRQVDGPKFLSELVRMVGLDPALFSAPDAPPPTSAERAQLQGVVQGQEPGVGSPGDRRDFSSGGGGAGAENAIPSGFPNV